MATQLWLCSFQIPKWSISGHLKVLPQKRQQFLGQEGLSIEKTQIVGITTYPDGYFVVSILWNGRVSDDRVIRNDMFGFVRCCAGSNVSGGYCYGPEVVGGIWSSIQFCHCKLTCVILGIESNRISTKRSSSRIGKFV